MTGVLYVGTSGFAYPDWAPRFYPAGTRASRLLAEYAIRLSAVELNNTFYQQPRPERVAAWLAATPDSFRFIVKAQRGGSLRAFGAAAPETIAWLTTPYRLFGERLGSVLYRVPGAIKRDDDRLAALLGAWPRDLPLTIEFQHPSWIDDSVLALLRASNAVLCATDIDDVPPPDLRLTGPFAYVRLRRTSYSSADLDDWAARLVPFLSDGRNAYVFLRHDAEGEAALRASALRDRVERLLDS
ncbi:MAG TPA: DUF72 domain-containing protein [Candidatus Caenarcaniphilales bacterium]|nr:DUF72 domain-containing protein [Candidatus Caenarcaniphilales bacterium]